MSTGLVSLGDPREHAVAVSLGLTAWGIFVALALSGVVPVHQRGSVGALVAVACLVRLPLLTWPPTLSDDVYRYVWEGRVWLAGFSPFASAPDAAELAFLRDADWSHVNHRSVSSVYPPLAQLLFVLFSGFGVWGFKVAMAAADCATAALLWRRDPRSGWLWALLPLPAVESAANGHLEAVGVLLVVLALRGSDFAAFLGAMLKGLPAVFLVRRPPQTWLLYAVLGVFALLPLVGEGLTRGMRTYEASWSFNAGVYGIVAWGLGDGLLARRLLLCVGMVIVALALLRLRNPARIALWTFGAFVVLSPTVHPWYVLWPLGVAIWLGERAWVALAALVPLAYLVIGTLDPFGVWQESLWVRFIEWVPFAVLLGWDAWHRFSRAGSG